MNIIEYDMILEKRFMDYENYIELYEAVYFFDRLTNHEEIKRPEIKESVYKATARILVANKLLDYDGNGFVMTGENKEKHRDILDNIINKNIKHYTEMFDKAGNESQFFFDGISELEFEIYSRYNFPVTFETGKEIVKHINFAGKKALELGGNSGGLGTAAVSKNKNCRYTVVDAKIPCMIGNEFKKSNKVNIKFIEGNVFELMLSGELYDYIIIMNLLHDFDDIKCLDILRNCIKYCGNHTKFLIIEDILTGEFEPKEAVMHGLRLAVECRGGKQRTINELTSLFSNINYKLEKTIKLNSVHIMLIMGAL